MREILIKTMINKDIIDNIISEEIEKVVKENLNESFLDEKKNSNRQLAKLIRKFLDGGKKRNRKAAQKRKLRRTKNGGKQYYDYEDYEEKNKKVSQGDASSIRNTIDTEKTNMAAIARILFPDHTEEGAQSQFRKIVNGERPMTKKIASKIEKLISRGKIAVK